jgi:hypothetical protein
VGPDEDQGGTQVIWAAILNSRPVRFIGAALVAFAGLMAWGAAKKRDGAAEARADAAARDAQANEEAHDRINQADTGAGLSDDQRRKRLRDFAAKHGNRPPEAGGR